MYHAFGNYGERASRFVLPIRQFTRQLAWLKRLGYCVISLEEFLRHRRHGPPPRRSVVITIDDGYAELSTLVYPILQQYRIPATVFAVSGMVGAHNNWATDSELRGRQLATWDEIRNMAREYVQIGAHTRTHQALTQITLQQALDEIAGSKADLEGAVGIPICTFAYPFGEYNAAIQALVESAGFMGICTADPGPNSLVTPLTALRRIEVKGTWSLPRFLFAVLLGSKA
jgi:peptidoglycan/xylan/chitin deacetylase (PgdA/CDA1 family)